MTPAAPGAIEAPLLEVVRGIVEAFDPESVILLGSYVRGDTNEKVSIDLLVVLKGASSKREQAIKIRGALHGLGLGKDVWVVSPEELDRDRDLAGTIAHWAVSEGRILYQRG